MLIKRGDKSEDVKKLQLKLGVEAIGTFGPKTEAAVREFQQKNGLTVDGIVGPITWNMIMNPPPQIFDFSKIKEHVPAKVYDELGHISTMFEINTPLRVSHFLSQCAHESMNFKLTIENLNYSSDGLLRIFPRYFTKLTAIKYQRSPERIANIVYANRMGNGSIESGDGWKYRGRGYIQLTGKNNYRAFDAFVEENIVEQPELVALKYPLLSAGWFFHTNNLNIISDKGSTDEVITELTRRINGGVNGLSDRIKYFKKYYNILK
jgi:putative chitinase